MPVDMAALLADVVAETAVTRSLVAGLSENGWRTPTPAPGWDIADQIGHLAYFDQVAVRAVVDPDEFRAELAAIEAAGINSDAIAARTTSQEGTWAGRRKSFMPNGLWYLSHRPRYAAQRHALVRTLP